MKEPLIIGSVRPSLVGDCIASLPLTTYLKKIFPNCYQVAYIDKKCVSVIPFLTNHPNIDEIYVSELTDKISKINEEYFNNFDIVFEPFPPVINSFWFNEINLVESLFRMNIVRWHGRINPIEFNKLTKEEKYPKLFQYFDIPRFNKTIAIWGETGYGNNDPTIKQRSPPKEFWTELIDDLNKLGFQIRQYGHPKSASLGSCVKDCRNLSLFDAVKESLGCDLILGTDSGSQHILAAYGARQCILYTNWRENHVRNFEALLPINFKNNLISLYFPDITNIDKNVVIDTVKQLI